MNSTAMIKAAMVGLMCAVAQMAMPALAQSGAWRCPGNYYTNSAAEARELGGCTKIEAGNVTVISTGGRTSPRSNPPAQPRPQGTTPSSGGSSSIATNGGGSDTRVSPQVQQQRDGDARKLLELELNNKQNELTLLQREYNSGEPERLLSEANDDAKYQSRIERLSREIERKVADIQAIQNELSRSR